MPRRRTLCQLPRRAIHAIGIDTVEAVRHVAGTAIGWPAHAVAWPAPQVCRHNPRSSFSGPYRFGSEGPKIATVGVPTAAARCMGPVSAVTKSFNC